jgi:hypothetical protein
MFLAMAELGDAFDPKSYPGLFSELIPPDREAALATMMRENIRPATVRAAGYIGAETDLRPVLQSRHPVSLCFPGSVTPVWLRTRRRVRRRYAGSWRQ